MENPYARAAAPTASTPEQQKTNDYELAIARNVGYYLPRFERFDNNESLAGWHWPAFFFTSGWYLYRKMWLWGLLNLFFPYLAAIVVGIVSGLLKVESTATVFIVLGAIAIEQILLTIFANSLYWKHINGIIRDIPRTLADKPDKRMRRLERDGGTSVGAMIGILFGLGIFGTGILAAIAIPAYQDYTIRSQVMEGLTLAAGPKAAVAEYFAQHHEWPVDAEAAGLSPISGSYVESVNIANGSVVISYGGRANRIIQGQRLIVAPGLTERGDIKWVCGELAMPPDVVSEAPGPHGSDVANKYLPGDCRG